jgi:geranylgeranyl diphosphate synthase type 3
MALSECHKLNNPQAMEVFVSEMLNLHRGQGYDIMWRDQCKCPSEDEYRDMVLNKTGGLFRLAVGLMQAFSDNKTDFTKLLNALGLYFQIRDDFVNISSASYMLSKSFCEDLTEGKFSFPIIHAIHACPNDSRLLNILRQRSEDENIKRHAVQWMDQCGSITYTRNVLRGLKDEVVSEIVNLGGNPVLIKLIAKLDDQLDEDCKEQLDKTNMKHEIVTTL